MQHPASSVRASGAQGFFKCLSTLVDSLGKCKIPKASARKDLREDVTSQETGEEG